jgi:hypothetical protein
MNNKSSWWKSAVAFLGWAVIFGLIYAQSPLYTSNQNTYFLHGLAQAGFGQLSRDWTAHTLELMPVFGGLVFLTYKIFHSETISYMYYALLMGVYLFSMFGVMDMLFDLRRSKARTLAFTALFLAFHSAALRFVLSRGVDADATFLFEGGVAGQRILGQVFQPSAFGVFLPLSIYFFLRKRPYLALISMAVAIYFHPVYLLAGALLTIAYMWIIWREEKNIKQPFFLGLTSLLIVAPVVAYTAYINWSSSPAVAAEVLNILVNFRNPHHALVASWLDWTVAVKASIFIAALVIVRKTRLFAILAIVALGVTALTIAQVVTGSNTLALLFPWRVSILLMPLGLAAVFAYIVTKIRIPERLTIALSIVLITGLVAVGVMRFQIEYARLHSGTARPMMAWVAAHQSPTDTYLIPAKLADFRLVTGMPVFIDFESAPDRSDDVLEWYRRLQLVYAFFNGQPDPCAVLHDLAVNESLTRAVVPATDPGTFCPSYPVVYSDANYIIYEIK